MPANSVFLGELQITTQTGQQIIVDLYHLMSEQPGAFSVGEFYYRGGNSDELLRVLRELSKRPGSDIRQDRS